MNVGKIALASRKSERGTYVQYIISANNRYFLRDRFVRRLQPDGIDSTRDIRGTSSGRVIAHDHRPAPDEGLNVPAEQVVHSEMNPHTGGQCKRN